MGGGEVLDYSTRVPELPATAIRRPRLEGVCVELLDRSHHLAIIAPAGAGKSVLAQQVASALSLPASWLILDAADLSPSRVLLRLRAALGDEVAASDERLRSYLRSWLSARECADLLAVSVRPMTG